MKASVAPEPAILRPNQRQLAARLGRRAGSASVSGGSGS